MTLERSSETLTDQHPDEVMSRGVAHDTETAPSVESARTAVERARDGLLARQADDGHWIFEFEADCTIPSEYVLMMHFLDEVDEELQTKLAIYIQSKQAEHGGWPLYLGGELDISATVKAYWAMKLAGHSVDAPHMVRAREAILELGGAARVNVFTRFSMAMFGQVPWRAVPFTPVELILLPRWSPFHYDKISYWSRAVVVPLTILYHKRAKAVNPTGTNIRELFAVPPEEERNYFPVRSKLNRAFLTLERTARRLEPLIPGFLAKRALRLAEQWMIDRLNGQHGLGGVFPAMVNALTALATLGYERDHELRATAREAIDRLLVVDKKSAYCQPCVSPIWGHRVGGLGLGRGAHGVRQRRSRCLAGAPPATGWPSGNSSTGRPTGARRDPASSPAAGPSSTPTTTTPTSTTPRQSCGHSSGSTPTASRTPSSGAPTGAAGCSPRMAASERSTPTTTRTSCSRFRSPTTGALLDPPTADVSARCATIFALLGREEERDALARCVDYLLAEQEENGSWFGRWGTNYVYGTWCVLMAFEQIPDNPRIERARARAVAWLKSVQREDGSWGESNDTYAHPELAGGGQEGTSYQTAWALLGLMAAGEAHTPEVRRGVAWLEQAQEEGGLWDDPWFSAPGFPRVFYLRYTGYSAYFPLWALARYCRHEDQRRR